MHLTTEISGTRMIFCIDPYVCFVRMSVCSHHYESEVVSVGVAVIRALDLYFVASHSADLHLVDSPGETQ